MSVTPATPLRAVTYSRVSKDEQAKGFSIPSQRDHNRRHCEDRGYDIVAELAEDFTGTAIHRPEMDKLLALVLARKVDVVVAYVTDRLTRGGPAHLGWFMTTFADYGVRLERAGKDVDDSAEGELFGMLEAYGAKKQVQASREASIRGINAKVASGKPIGASKPPYGLRYKVADYDALGNPVHGTLKAAYEPNHETLPHLLWIFDQCDHGVSIRQIGLALESAGVLPPRYGYGGSESKIWNPSTIKHILSNPVYVGDGTAFHRRKNSEGGPVKLADGVFPQVIERDLFDRVQKRLAGNKKDSQRHDRDPENGLLRRGFVVCGNCGSRLMVNPGARGGPAYRCHPQARHRHKCPGAGILVDTLDTQVWAWVEAIRSNPRQAADLAERLRNQHDDGREAAMLASLDKRIADLEDQRGRLVKRLALVDDDTAALVGAELIRLASERKDLEAQRPAFVDRFEAEEQRRQRATRAVAIIEGTIPATDDLTYGEKRRMLSDLGVVVRLYPTDAPQRWTLTLSYDVELPAFGKFNVEEHTSSNIPARVRSLNGHGHADPHRGAPFDILDGEEAWNLFSIRRATGAMAAR